MGPSSTGPDQPEYAVRGEEADSHSFAVTPQRPEGSHRGQLNQGALREPTALERQLEGEATSPCQITKRRHGHRLCRCRAHRIQTVQQEERAEPDFTQQEVEEETCQSSGLEDGNRGPRQANEQPEVVVTVEEPGKLIRGERQPTSIEAILQSKELRRLEEAIGQAHPGDSRTQ